MNRFKTPENKKDILYYTDGRYFDQSHEHCYGHYLLDNGRNIFYHHFDPIDDVYAVI